MTEDATPNGIEQVDGLDLDPQRLPAQFRHLVPLIREWAIGDDAERSEKEEAASTEELQELHDTVSPLFDALDAYTRPFRDGDEPVPDEVVLLDWLAEAAAEVHFVLKRRGKRGSS